MKTDTERQAEDADGFDIGAIAEELGIKAGSGERGAKGGEPEADGEAQAAEPGEAAGDEGETDESRQDGEAEEAAEESAEESEDGADKAADDEDADEAKPDRIQKRIDKLVAQRHEVENQLKAIEAEREELRKQVDAKPATIVVDPENPLSQFGDVESLRGALAKAQEVLDWAEENREGGEIKTGDEAKFYDAEAVKTIRANAKAALRAGPAQEKFLHERAATVAEARTVYPELFKSGSPEQAAMVAALKQFPFMARVPGLELMVGDAFTGMKLRQAKHAQMQRKQAQQERKPTPAEQKVVKPLNATAQPKGVGNKAETARKHLLADVFKTGGKTESLEKYAESLL